MVRDVADTTASYKPSRKRAGAYPVKPDTLVIPGRNENHLKRKYNAMEEDTIQRRTEKLRAVSSSWSVSVSGPALTSAMTEALVALVIALDAVITMSP